MIQWIISSDERRELERAAAEPVKPERKRRGGSGDMHRPN